MEPIVTFNAEATHESYGEVTLDVNHGDTMARLTVVDRPYDPETNVADDPWETKAASVMLTEQALVDLILQAAGALAAIRNVSAT